MIVMFYDFMVVIFFFFKRKTAYEMRISDWSSDVCSSDLMSVGGLAVVVRMSTIQSFPSRRRPGYRPDGTGQRRRVTPLVAVAIISGLTAARGHKPVISTGGRRAKISPR